MFTIKIFGLLALALFANGTDLQKGLDLMRCAKEAITVGVPELGIPSHEPFVPLKTVLNLDEDLGIAEGIFNITNMTWAGLARWNLNATQLSLDTDPFAAFDFELYWDWMELGGHYRFEEKAIFVDVVQTGTFAVELNRTSWTGSINVTKAGETPSQKNGTVDDVQIDWHVEKVGVNITGLGSLADSSVELALKTAIKTGLNNKLIGNTVGDFIKMRLKTIWWDTGKVWDLVNWCTNSNITSVNKCCINLEKKIYF